MDERHAGSRQGGQRTEGTASDACVLRPGQPEEKLHYAGAGGDWNDVPSGAVLPGYVVEYEPDQTNSPPVADAGGAYAAVTDAVLVDIEPNKISLQGKARWVTAFLLPDDAGTAEVGLDGTASSDEDGDDLTYSWTVRDGSGSGVAGLSGATPSVELGVGSYTVELVVNDGYVDSEPSESTVEVTVIDLSGITPESLMLCGPAPGSPAIGQKAELDEWGALMVKFSRDAVAHTLIMDEMNLLTLDGAVQGEDTVMVVGPKDDGGKGKGKGKGK